MRNSFETPILFSSPSSSPPPFLHLSHGNNLPRGKNRKKKGSERKKKKKVKGTLRLTRFDGGWRREAQKKKKEKTHLGFGQSAGRILNFREALEASRVEQPPTSHQPRKVTLASSRLPRCTKCLSLPWESLGRGCGRVSSWSWGRQACCFTVGKGKGCVVRRTQVQF